MARYSAYNFDAYNTHKTIECRLHAGSIDYTEISNWVKLHLAIVDYAKNDTIIGHTDNSVRELLNRLVPELYTHYTEKEKSNYPDRIIPSIGPEGFIQAEEAEITEDVLEMVQPERAENLSEMLERALA